MTSWTGMAGRGEFRQCDEPASDDRWAIKAVTRLAKSLASPAGVPVVYGVGPTGARLVDELATGSMSRMQRQHLCVGLPSPVRPHRQPKRAAPHDYFWPQQPVRPIRKVWIVLRLFEAEFRVLHAITEAWLARDVPVYIVGLCADTYYREELEELVTEYHAIRDGRSCSELSFDLIRPDHLPHAPWKILRLLVSDAKASRAGATA